MSHLFEECQHERFPVSLEVQERVRKCLQFGIQFIEKNLGPLAEISQVCCCHLPHLWFISGIFGISILPRKDNEAYTMNIWGGDLVVTKFFIEKDGGYSQWNPKTNKHREHYFVLRNHGYINE